MPNTKDNGERNIQDVDTAIVKVARPYTRREPYDWNKPGMLDDYITRMCLEQTMGDVIRMRETSSNARTFFAASLIVNAVLERDTAAITQIISRIDGAVPDSKERKDFANYFGNALEDVMDYPRKEQTLISPDDLAIIALAKIIYQMSVTNPGNNVALRKEKSVAIDIVLTRTGGKIPAPVRKTVEKRFAEPAWMQQLPEGDE